MPAAATPSSAKPKDKGKAAAAKKARPSEDSKEEQKMDMDDENDHSNVVFLEEVRPRRKFVKRVMGDPEEGDINSKTLSILKPTKGDARARVKKRKVDEGKSKMKAVKSNEEQQPEEEERKTKIESRITQETPPQRRKSKSLPSSPVPIPTKHQ